MLFFGGAHSEHKRHGSNPILLFFRMILSLSMLAILLIGGFAAFRHFSGIDPTTSDPKALIISTVWEIVGSEDLNQILSKVLDAKVPTNLDEIKNLSNLTNETYSANWSNSSAETSSNPTPKPGAKMVLKFALVADSHKDSKHLSDALYDAREKGAKFVIGLGDYSEVGTDEELKEAKAIFDKSGLPYYLTAGDHDLWNARDKGIDPEAKFHSIFGPPYQSFGDSGVRFLILYDSDNYQGLDHTQISWLEDEVNRLKTTPHKLSFAFTHEPLYHPSSDHAMGRVTPSLRSQADQITQLLQSGKVDEVFYGDTHFFSRYLEPKTNLRMTAVGAVTEDRNTQKPRYAMVEVYDDGAYNIRDIELK